jgi:hypothetical protein
MSSIVVLQNEMCTSGQPSTLMIDQHFFQQEYTYTNRVPQDFYETANNTLPKLRAFQNSFG